mmetsp:Transcript_24799/g.93803  ORF Transcript_24799/g.93803 Transcript_24799/m.93803 type:complete len:324 (-) Transcript_24799:544-1515(-)
MMGGGTAAAARFSASLRSSSSSASSSGSASKLINDAFFGRNIERMPLSPVESIPMPKTEVMEPDPSDERRCEAGASWPAASEAFVGRERDLPRASSSPSSKVIRFGAAGASGTAPAAPSPSARRESRAGGSPAPWARPLDSAESRASAGSGAMPAAAGDAGAADAADANGGADDEEGAPGRSPARPRRGTLPAVRAEPAPLPPSGSPSCTPSDPAPAPGSAGGANAGEGAGAGAGCDARPAAGLSGTPEAARARAASITLACSSLWSHTAAMRWTNSSSVATKAGCNGSLPAALAVSRTTELRQSSAYARASRRRPWSARLSA